MKQWAESCADSLVDDQNAGQMRLSARGMRFAHALGSPFVNLGGTTMRPSLQISFRNGPLSEAIADAIEDHAAKLGQFYDQISRCRVVIDVPHKHHHHGNAERV